MIIKNYSPLKVNLGKIGFKTVTANVALGIIFWFLVINWLISIMPAAHIGYIGQTIFVIIIWSIFTIIPGMFESVYNIKSHRDENQYHDVISDFKKSLLYLFIVLSVLVTLHLFRDQTKDSRQVNIEFANTNKNIPVAAIQTFEIHNAEDNFAIRYLDKDGVELFRDIYTKLESRTNVLNRIIDKHGKPLVDMYYIKNDGKEKIEMYDKKINL